MRKADIFLHERVAGQLEELEDRYRFRYLSDYLADPQALPVSQSLPLRAEPYEDKRLFPFFDGLIPEGWLLHIAETTWKIDPRDRMGLLLACCRDCIGAVCIVPIKEDESNA